MGLLYSPHTCMYILTTCLLAMKVVANLCGIRGMGGGVGLGLFSIFVLMSLAGKCQWAVVCHHSNGHEH